MKKIHAVLPLLMFVSACHHGGDAAASFGSESAEAASTESAVPAPTSAASVAADDGADRFDCAYGGNKADEYQVAMTDFAPGGDHLGPIGEYKVTGGGAYKGATGAVRQSDENTYEFLDGPLGKAHAKLMPSSQGFYALLVGNSGAQCEKQGGEQDQ